MKAHLLLLLSILCCSQGAFAAAPLASSITYRHISGNRYLVIAKLYRDCRALPWSGSGFNFYVLNDSVQVQIPLIRTNIADVTPLFQNPCNPQNTLVSARGTEEHTFEGIVNFDSSAYAFFKNRCKVWFALSACCRSSSLTTLNAGNIYNECSLDLCLASGNSGPALLTPPHTTGSCYEANYLNIGAADTIDHDILTFSFTSALNDHNSDETYKSSFSADYPVTPYCPGTPGQLNCKPLPNAPPPRGVFLDKYNGNMIFTPSSCSEISDIVIQVTEWRRINGTLTTIGTYMTDYTYAIAAGSGSTPQITGNRYSTVQANHKISMSVSVSDADTTSGDSVALFSNNGIAGGAFTLIYTGRQPKGIFTWIPSCDNVRPEPYHFVMSAFDKSGHYASSDFAVQVISENLIMGNDTDLCKPFSLKLSTQKSSGTFHWSTGDSSQSITVTQPGKYGVGWKLGNCESTDTIIVYQDVAPPVVNLGADRLICNQDPPQPVLISTGNNNTRYKYSWSSHPGQTQPLLSTTYAGILVATVANSCGAASDTMHITRDVSPTVTLRSDTSFCLPLNYSLETPKKPGYTYQWNDGSADTALTVTNAGNYSITVTNVCGTAADTITIGSLPDPSVFIGNDTTICNRAVSLTLTAKAVANTLTWSDGSHGNTLNVFNEGMYAVTAANSCGNAYDTIRVRKLNSPSVYLGPDKVFCDNNTVLLDATSMDADYTWSDGKLTPSIYVNQSGTYSVHVDNYCGSDDDTITLTHKLTPVKALGSDISLTKPFTLVLDAQNINAGARYRWLTSPADTFRTLTVSEFGTYTVRIYNECGQVLDDITLSDKLSVKNIEAIGLRIYPNPSDGVITVMNENSAGVIKRINVFATDGRLLITGALMNNTIDISHLADGMYLLAIDTNNHTLFTKVILKH